MASVIAGLVGGLIATIVMSIVMKFLGGGPPPTAALLAKFMGGEPGDRAKPGMLLHMIYGTGAGLVFAVGVPIIGLDLASIVPAVGLGLVYGLVLMIGGMAFWLKGIIGMEPDRDMLVTFGIVHVVYGLVLGALLGAGILS
jgi:hypothetical protein